MTNKAKKCKRVAKEPLGHMYYTYSVPKGRTTGLFITWLTCNKLTNCVKDATANL